jgi:hypothetical protein
MALVVEIPEPLPKSKIRASGPGMPALDLAYRAWRDRLIDEANRRWLDAHWPGLPAANLVEPWSLDEALFLATGGSRMFWAESETNNHRTSASGRSSFGTSPAAPRPRPPLHRHAT